MKQRLLWVDTIRLYACFMVAWLHLFEAYDYIDVIKLFVDSSSVTHFVFYGLRYGKSTLVLFSVLAGYFAGKKANTKTDFLHYSTARYIQFAFGIFVAEAIMFILSQILHFQAQPSVIAWITQPQIKEDIKNILNDIVFLDWKYADIFWCIANFFIGSVLSFVAERYKIKSRYIILFILICRLVRTEIFTGLVLVGVLLLRFLRAEETRPRLKKWMHHPVMWIVLLALTVLCYQKQSNINNEYMINGVSSFCFLLLCFHCKPIQKILGFRAFSGLGKLAYGIYVFHVPVLSTVMHVLNPYMKKLPSPISDICFIGIYYIITFILAWLFEIMLGWINNKAKSLYQSKEPSV